MHILLRNGKNMSQKPSQSSQFIQQFKEKKKAEPGVDIFGINSRKYPHHFCV